MTPTCASCGQSITKGKGQKVTIVGTEAFHQRCVVAGGVYNSRGNRLARALKEEQDLRQNAQRAHDDLIEDMRRTAERKIEHERRLANNAIATRNEYVVLATQQDQLIGDLRTELERVRRQLADAHQQVENTKTTITRPSTPAETTVVDESAVRFSLLELDLK